MAAERLCIRARPLTKSWKASGRKNWQQPLSTASKARAQPPVSAPAAVQNVDGENAFSSFSSDVAPIDEVAQFDPAAHAKPKVLPRGRYLPPSSSPRYYRGPLHPRQPPPPSDPSSRLFQAGPFTLPRMQQTYNTTLSHDLMTIYYEHVPPGTPKMPPKERLREWDDDSPYVKNRPLRPPRGDPRGRLGLQRKPINWWNLPRLERISVSIQVREGASSSPHLHAAGMILQSMTGARAHMTRAKKSTPAQTFGQRTVFNQKRGKPIAVTVDLRGEEMWHFLSTLVAIAMPRIKNFTGVRGRSGDANGNLQIGLDPSIVGGWPEIASNYDAYPPEMIPGVGITLHSTARSDRDMRLLMSSLGFPFKGNHRTRGP